MSAQPESWRVSTVEGVFETDLETLKRWIIEGSVLPTDKVSKGNLNWIEAGRAPMLRAAFSGESSTREMAPNVATTTESAAQMSAASFVREPAASLTSIANACQNHPETAPKYVCRVCATRFCAECPKFVGTSNIPICPLCGDLCRLFEEERSKVVRHNFQSAGFGFVDLLRAFRYPFQHKVALFCGALMYGLLLLAGFRGHVVAFVIMFGCIAHVISQVAWGKLDRSFLPDFSAFSMWDDVAVPIGLGIGITIVTWGPVIAILVALFFGVISGPKMSSLGGVPAPGEQQSAGVQPGDLDALTDPNADPKKLEEANKKLNQLRPGAQISQEAERSKKVQSDPLAELRFFLGFLQVPWFILLLLLLSVVWGIFYGPMALAVAGYTEDFGSVINPLIGLDTIRRMGITYFKAFGMVILIQVAGLVIAGIVAVILSPLDLPFFGNLPAKFVDGSLTFYFNLVIACVLGLSLHKCADRLGIGGE
jgi:hypothetical protein